MTAKILDGWKLSQSILAGLPSSQKAKLAVVQVGNNLISTKYIREKEKTAKALGFGFQLYRFPEKIKGPALQSSLMRVAKDAKNTGLLIQLPLPSHLSLQEVLDCIPLQKDVDVLSSKALGLFSQGALPWLPPTVKAVSILLEESKVQLKGARVLLIGAGRLVGLPVSLWLLQEGATLTIANKATKNLSSLTKQADVIISGVGKQRLVKGGMVKKGAVVIDAGTSVEGGKTKGDVDFKSVSKKASFITPVPGGVGPLTVACLFRNLDAINLRT
jgi:methylenetetrahydrofolate dehydrogenase (NADP+)/methenyltetrahydrofolate cyclohydrolase